ncbi:acetyltransferase, GNAT family [Purpureocillium lavendulum]|uniref:Acetyltransferase, GNAT family n=1 Tax=Purpureocillium lavendulum TaxID=1247861 RepID=A0AB34FT57_9HYPO|nr:acetyltransferase, GNAT family [Purpureocillium lavendulum]
MGTPFITLLEPSKLEGYLAGVRHDEQPAAIPQPFLDAMEVRESVFVDEQKVPLENEFDADDPRSCHWVIYASINKTEEVEVRDEEGNVVQPRRSSTRTTPIGTVRLVPFPHEPHPKDGGDYWNGVLAGEEGDGPNDVAATPGRSFAADRPTTFHDGKEPYVKLGRLAVIKDFRGNNLAGLLANTVLAWLKRNPSYFDPSITELGLEQMGAANETEVPKWNGLVCVHSQEKVVGAWEKWGFRVDEGMGKWWEEGIPHVGMFQRLEVNPQGVRI